MLLEIRSQSRIFVETDQSVVVPGIDQIVPGPFHFAVEDIPDQSQLEQPGGFDQVSVFGDEHTVVASRNADSHLCIDLERRETLLQSAQERELLRRMTGPRVRALKPRIYAGNTQPVSNDHRFCVRNGF